MFIPFDRHIEIEPLTKNGVILSETDDFISAGKVIALPVKDEYCYDIKLGDILHFNSYGCHHTHDRKHWVVSMTPEVILGIERHESVPQE